MDQVYGAPKRSADSSGNAKKKFHENPEDMVVLFSTSSKVGSLNDALAIFKSNNVDLSHIESRPSRRALDEYDFFVNLAPSTSANLDKTLKELAQVAANIQVFDSNPDSTNPMWFPRRMRELDLFASRILGAGSELESDHPGFTDPVYRARRQYFADIALHYKYGEVIPRVQYTPEETQTWGVVFENLSKLYETHACAEFNRVFPLLIENCGYRKDNIPQLEDISRFLHDSTGFRIRPVAGLLSSRDFLAGLAFRVFHSTQYIRHASRPMYTPEPDVCHEILGHVPLFADRAFAEFSQEIGLASLGVSDEDVTKLATCYWFTVEFGLCRQQGQIRAFGAGLLSSFGELEYCLTDKPKLLPFDPEKTGVQSYPITEYQPVYFVAESFEDAKRKLRDYAATLKRPFQVHYNAYTESIEILNSSDDLQGLAASIHTDMTILLEALKPRN